MTTGIHHISAIASDAQKTIDFYSGVLGLRLVKQTVNQDDPGVYHLFFGDKEGLPGMDLTFFVFLPTHQGKVNTGMVSKISFAVPNTSLGFWEKRFIAYNVNFESLTTRFARRRLVFYDPDNLQLELVEITQDDCIDDSNVYDDNDIPKTNAIIQFFSATLLVLKKSLIEPVITSVLGYTLLQMTESITLYIARGSSRAQLLEIQETHPSEDGVNTAGTVHHIAFRTRDENEQQKFRSAIEKLGLHPTDVIDRFYFKSIYFKTHAGILFELATEGPGFIVDQSVEDLGTSLSLPPFLQPFRPQIEKHLPKLLIKKI